MEFRINRVYTRSGDSGETGLVGGRRVRKTDPRVVAYGDLDELNAVLGLVKAQLSAETAELHPLLEQLQQQLFDLGSELATDPADSYPGMWQVAARHVTALEQLCDRFGEGLPELSSFLLPGGSLTAATLHLARTVARRAERSVLSLAESGGPGEGDTTSQNNRTGQELPVSPEAVQYLNRLSDLLFVLARWSIRAEGRDAPLWVLERDRKRI